MAANNEKVTLKSSDGEEFEIPVSVAKESGAIAPSLECDDVTVIPVTQVDAKTLGEIIPYMTKSADKETEEEKKLVAAQFVADYKGDFSNLLNLVLAANFLDIKCLLDALATAIAEKMENKSVEWVRKRFNVECDFTPQEENEITNENSWAHEGIDPDD